ncbi:MAG: RNA polymerase sigma factor [Minicystis sp.]
MTRAAEASARRRPARTSESDVPLAPAEPRSIRTAADDATLLRAVARGDLGSLGVLFDRHHEAVRQFVRRASTSNADVDDVVQETFLTAARVAASFDGRTSALPFLLGIATRLRWRRRRSFARLRALCDAFSNLPAPPPLDPEATVSLAEEGSLLRDAIARLSDDQRSVLVMFEYSGLSGIEIAQALEIPVGTVWRRLHEARAELRTALARRAR